MTDPWGRNRRMLSEQCEGRCGMRHAAIYSFDLPSGVRLWLCPSCWIGVRRAHPGSVEVFWDEVREVSP
jgi:hypothetical protein